VLFEVELKMKLSENNTAKLMINIPEIINIIFLKALFKITLV